METEFEIKGNVYRIKKMNAIELLALRSQISFEDLTSAEKFYNEILEKFEVKLKDNWLQVKNGNDYFPAGIEDDLDVISELISKMMEYLREVFIKSSKSK